MTVQNVAIVFGPTLLRPEMESSNITMYMVFQNQIVEFILNEYERIFYWSRLGRLLRRPDRLTLREAPDFHLHAHKRAKIESPLVNK